MAEEIRDDEIIVDKKTGFHCMKTTRTRYYTMHSVVALIVIVVTVLSALIGYGVGELYLHWGLSCH